MKSETKNEKGNQNKKRNQKKTRKWTLTLIFKLDGAHLNIIDSKLILFYNKTDSFDQNSKYLAGARTGVERVFS